MLFVFFNSLHLKFERQEQKQLQYRGIVVRCLYDTKRAMQKEKAANKLLEKQKYQIIYDKLDVLARDTRIQKLEVNV